MKRRSALRQSMVVSIVISLLAPSANLYAQDRVFPIDLLPPMRGDGNTEDQKDADTGLFPPFPGLGNSGNGGKTGEDQGGAQGNNQTRPGRTTVGTGGTTTKPTTSKNEFTAAKVPAEFSCPLFENSSSVEIFTAIEALSKEVKISPACSGTPSGQTLQDSTKTIQDSMTALMAMMGAQTAGEVNPAQIEQSVTSAIGALGSIGDVINNNEFLNSDCGRQTMSTGKILLALNDVIAGLGPFALLAVSMNAALTPALPFVVGAVVGTTGISAITKMFNKKLIDMNNPEHRKAIVQNTCQFVKVSEKVRYLQLAQAGRMDQINKELSNKISLYSAELNLISQKINTSISQRNAYLSAVTRVEAQLAQDRAELTSLKGQIDANDDKFLMCVLANEMTQWSRDGVSFPISAFKNFQLIAGESDRAMQAQSRALIAVHHANVAKINQFAKEAANNDNALNRCASATTAWFNGIEQALNLTKSTAVAVKGKVENELSKSTDYVTYQNHTKKIESEKSLVRKVTRALEELSRDNSIIDRSEMSQRLLALKAGLFKGSSMVPGSGAYSSLVQQWINHTKKMHDQMMASVTKDLEVLRQDSFSLTDAGRILFDSAKGKPYLNVSPAVGSQSYQASKNLTNFNLNTLPLGTREHEVVCQRLQTAILDYTAAMDHLGSIDLFCGMIDPVLDSKVDASVLTSCLGQSQVNGYVYKESLVNSAKAKLVSMGFQADYTLIKKREAELQCALPPTSILNR